MENRIDACFAALREKGTPAFISYTCAGDPDLDTSLQVLHALDRAGVDLLEIGLPFSDPLADGIVNQLAADRALKAGTTIASVFSLVEKFRQTSQAPIVLYAYLNNLYTYGYQKFLHDAATAGIDGILQLDLPPDEAALNAELPPDKDIKQIRLITPTSSPERMRYIASQAEGFIYYVSRVGVTGARDTLPEDLEEKIGLIRDATDLPIAVGFGISSPAQAAEVASHADAIVVGSAIVNTIAENVQDPASLPDKVHDFVQPLVDATHAARS